MKILFSNKLFQNSIYIVTIILPFLLVSYSLFFGKIAFWFDPARDFLLALDNLHKPTLIGPPSGIPGVFYGPYWIWMLSFGLLFSSDPRLVVFLTLTVMYFVLFPLVLYKFRQFFGIFTIILLWLLFALQYGIKYAINPWNPYIAPFACLLLIYFLSQINFENNKKKNLYYVGFAGLLSGLILNVHISFGIGIFMGVILFFILQKIFHKISFKKLFTNLILFNISILVVFIPFFLFEMRHGFHQIQTTLQVLLSSHAVVGLQGLSKISIIQGIFSTVTDYLYIPKLITLLCTLLLIIYTLYKIFTNKNYFSKQEKQLGVLIISLLSGIFFIYLTSKNPVWTYHFIGIEVLFLVVIGLLINKNKKIQIIIGVLVIYSYFQLYLHSGINFKQSSFSTPMLLTEEYIVKIIMNDAQDTEYTVFAYNPAIYTYEFSYLFKWLAAKEIPYDPGMIKELSNTVYLIIPNNTNSPQDFMNSKTNSKEFHTIKVWDTIDGSKIIKRVKSN